MLKNKHLYCFWANSFPIRREHAAPMVKAGIRITKLTVGCARVHMAVAYDRITMIMSAQILVLV